MADIVKKIKHPPQRKWNVAELFKLFKHMYEDNVNGKLSDIHDEELSSDYEAKQTDT